MRTSKTKFTRYLTTEEFVKRITLLLLTFLLVSSSVLPRDDDPQIYIRVNQLGFSPLASKVAIAFARSPLPDRFRVIEVASGERVFESAVRSIAGRWGQFDQHADLDFSTF